MIECWHWLRNERRVQRETYELETSANQVAHRLPMGVYTTIRTYERTKTLRFDDHLGRLEQSAALSGKTLWIDRQQFRNLLRVAINEILFPDEIKVRIHVDLTHAVGDFYLFLEPLTLPSVHETTDGVSAITRNMHRDNPLAKTTEFISTAETLRNVMPDGVNELLMINEDGNILEGLSSNFFAVKENTIWSAGEGILSGITRSLVFDAIETLGISIRKTAYPVKQIDLLDEAFLTSTSRGVLPLIRINDVTIGKGFPGVHTLKIRDEFARQVHEEIMPI